MKDKNWKKMNGSSGSGAVYGMGMIGAGFYFLQHATNLTDGILAIIKAIIWPGILVYKVLELLKF